MIINLSQYDVSDDASMMQAALDLAALGKTRTQPNPMVGCVIVREGKIVGSGFHEQAGHLHAERMALADAGEDARGGTAYVNLEPCCHQGRTPPCTDGLIDAGIVKVVSALRDPNPLVGGGGYELLRGAGVEVVANVLEKEARWLNRGFVSRMHRKRPWVVLKTAATLDGRTAAHDGQSKWITGDAARAQVQILRAEHSAVVTGIGTVLADDPELNVRLDGTQRQPLRVVLDPNLRCPLDARIISDDQQCLIISCSDDIDKTAALIEAGAEVIQVKGDENGQLDLNAVLSELAKWQCNEVMIESGQTLAGAFVESGLVDELALFYAGSVLGDHARSMFKFNAPLEFSQRPEYRVDRVRMIDSDIFVSATSTTSVEALV